MKPARNSRGLCLLCVYAKFIVTSTMVTLRLVERGQGLA